MMRTFFGMPCRKTARTPLCSLTGDIHLHTLVCPDEARKARVLAALEEKGYLTSYENEVNGKTRKYYSITKNGRNYLKDKKKEWQEYQTAVTNVLCMEG